MIAFGHVRNQGEHGSGETDENGRYTISGLAAGVYVVYATPGEEHVGWVSAPIEYIGVDRDATTENVDITMTEGCFITGQVTEKETGIPVPGCAVSAATYYKHLKAYNRTYLNLGTATTDENGRYRLSAPPGEVEITATHRSLYDVYSTRYTDDTHKKLVIEENRDLTGIDFRLTRLLELKGVVYLSDGRPAAGIKIVSPQEIEIEGISDEEGRFAIDGLLPGRKYTFTADSEELRLEGSVTVESVPGNTIEIRLHPYRYAVVSGRVVNTDGNPIQGEAVALYKALGMDAIEDSSAAVTGSDGRFNIDSLRVGKTYMLSFRGGQAKSPAFKAGEDVGPFEIVLPDADRWLAGRILGENGAPLAGVTVMLWSQRSGHQVTVTGMDGRFWLEGLVQETENLYFRDDPYFRFIFRDIPANVERDFVLTRGGRFLVGKVTDTSGTPVTGALVSADQKAYGQRQRTRETLTDNRGKFFIRDIYGKTVTVTIKLDGYETVTADSVATDGEAAEFILKPDTPPGKEINQN